MGNNSIYPNFWSAYKAINFGRFSKSREFIDARSGKTLSYSFIGEEDHTSNFLLGLCSSLLWMSPAALIVVMSALYAEVFLGSFFIGAIFVTLYHFLGMYYVIRGPLMEFHEVRKKRGFFKF